ncbi:MAG: hypothetical protein PHN69_06225 [Candidatus Pacebacteria bacterium]|nr:hypothetical protein [Candidatus Paceibacterota bacterium]
MTDVKAYLTYPLDRVTSRILLTERWVNAYRITFNGLTVDSKLSFSQTLLHDLAKKGASIEYKEVLQYSSKNNIGDIKVQTKVIEKDKVRVRITGKDVEDVFLKISSIKKYMAKFGYEPKQCVWDRIGRYS